MFLLDNGKMFVSGYFTAEHLDKVEKMVREHFPHADFKGFSLRDEDCK